MKNSVLIQCLFGAFLMASCNNGPKVIAPASEDGNSDKGSGIFSSDPATQVNSNSNTPFNEDLHKVSVLEVLPTERYTYLKVNEDGKQFWIAARKQEAKKGEIYFYRNGLLKTDFESKEYNRVFDTIYLVSNLVDENHSKNVGALDTNVPKMEQKAAVKEDIPT
ncbi:MAG: GW dipeptide domain-containing protein, partial [Maribacter sp.]|nr:GW dipeptide domain-containing protein [Maribacter sp.]